MKFLVHGSIAYDLLLRSDGSFADGFKGQDLDRLSVGFLAQGFVRHHGGTAANISWNLRLLGQDPLMIGTVGSDGAPYLSLLMERGIDTSRVQRRDDAFTATAFIATDSDERQITFYHPGADALGTLPDLTDDRDGVCHAIIAPHNPMLMSKAAAQCRALGIPFLFDPGQATGAFSRDELRAAVTGSNGLIVNAYEWSLAREKMEWDAADVLAACPLIVITQGEEGLTLHTRQDTVVIAACTPDRVINPTGAGDALRAGLLVGLGHGWTLTQAGQLGAAMGSFAVEQEGTLIDRLDIDDVRARVKENFEEELPLF